MSHCQKVLSWNLLNPLLPNFHRMPKPIVLLIMCLPTIDVNSRVVGCWTVEVVVGNAYESNFYRLMQFFRGEYGPNFTVRPK